MHVCPSLAAGSLVAVDGKSLPRLVGENNMGLTSSKSLTKECDAYNLFYSTAGATGRCLQLLLLSLLVEATYRSY